MTYLLVIMTTLYLMQLKVLLKCVTAVKQLGDLCKLEKLKQIKKAVLEKMFV